MMYCYEFASLFPDVEKVIVCGYRDLGLLCLDSSNDNKLTLVSAIASNQNDSKIWFGKVTTITLCPAPPPSAVFTHILPNKNGRILALVGPKLIMIVELNEDFWVNQSLLDASNVELQKEYFSKCNILHIGLFVGKNTPTILKASWYLSDNSVISSSAKAKKNYLNGRYVFGVLYSDNVIRFYNSMKNIEKPFLLIDFKELLFPEQFLSFHDTSVDEKECDSSILNGESRFGLTTQLVSFDFGPSYSLTEKNKPVNDLATIMAMDSDGNLYFAAFDFLDQEFFGPCGPLLFSNNESLSQKFLCSASDLLFVGHKFSSTMPVFAMSSYEGVIAHFVMVQLEPPEVLIKSRRNIFDLFVYDILEISDSHNNNAKLNLQNDFSEHPTYIALNRNNAYVVDVSSWVTSINHKILIGLNDLTSNTQELSCLKESRIMHILMFVDANILAANNVANKENIEKCTVMPSNTNCIRSLACVILNQLQQETLNDNDDEITKENVGAVVDQLFVALISKGKSLTSVVRHRISVLGNESMFIEKSRTEKSLNSVELTYCEKIQALLNSQELGVPKIKFDGLSRENELKLCQNVVDFLISNVQKINPIVDFSIAEATNILSKFDAVGSKYEKLNKRVETVFRQITEAKARILAYKRAYKILNERTRKIAQLLQPVNFPLKNEREVYNQLQDFQNEIKSNFNEINRMNIMVTEHRSKFLGSTVSFQPSARAQKFMLTKTDNEIKQLKICVQKLMNEAKIENL